MKNKLTKPHLVTLILIIIWIAIWNAIVLALGEELAALPFSSWAFFISVTFYYFLEEENTMKRFFSVLIGGAVGILCTLMLVLVAELLGGLGVNAVVAAMIPLCVVLVMLIIGKPYCPVVFNSIGFAYFIIAFIELDHVVERTPAYLLSLLLGCIILCGGCELLVRLVTKYYTNKAMKAGK